MIVAAVDADEDHVCGGIMCAENDDKVWHHLLS